jgi:hypothetical protein
MPDPVYSSFRQSIKKCTDRRICISDVETRVRFLDSLPPEFDREAIRFAVLQDRLRQGAGTNRNAILLAGSGSHIVSTDDDVSFAPVVRSAQGEGVADIASARPCEPRYFSNRIDLLGSVEVTGLDVESSYRSFFESASDGFCPVICAGSYGDSGFGEARGFLILEGPSRHSVIESGYERYRLSREVVRIPDHDVMGNGMTFMGMQCAFDAKVLLPPFFPVGRKEDSLFALTLRVLYPESKTLYPAFGFCHDPQTPRNFEHSDLVSFVPAVADIIKSLALESAPSLSKPDPAERMIALGCGIAEAAALDAAGFVSLVHGVWSRSAMAYAEKLESLLEKYEGTPSAWAADVTELLGNVYESAREPAFMFGKNGCGFSVDEARRQAELYGRLLQVWPDLVEYVRSSGDPLSHLAVDLDDL